MSLLRRWYEPVQIFRVGELLTATAALIDPVDNKLIFDAGVDVRAGDVTIFRGQTRRVVLLDETSRWVDAGVVATVEEAPYFLPDSAQMLRSTGSTFNKTTNKNEPNPPSMIWAGPCAVEPTDGAELQTSEQAVHVQSYTVRLPLDVPPVRVNDTIKIVASRDPALMLRPLTVTRMQASTTFLVRKVIALDNQG